ncbi:GNAT family N-acetyltransferase [Priestia koreensis]|uniref:GNAT family N-acetyltransferase n=1 Tax=Priestia koreensis TaxID=284581 RepID=UPI0020418617|nr:GNAT family N-acetyltransferase [Priestia koreensis]MCM3005032.1 GNAT family N-acetyltransferase [Priestia koreensis]
MAHVVLRSVNKGNWKEVARLSLKEEQKSFIASNLYSMVEVQFLENFKTKAIYRDEEMIGFTMYGIDEEDGNYWIYRFMIDQRFQGKGLGKKAMLLVIEDIEKWNSTNIPCIMIDYHRDNIGAKKMYRKVGFVETERGPGGEQFAMFTL